MSPMSRKQRQMLLENGERACNAVIELAARWHRACPEPGTVGVNDFTSGRMEGYVQAIALILEQEHAQVKAALEGGLL